MKRIIFYLIILLCVVACESKPMTDDQIIATVRKCERAGFEPVANYTIFNIDGPRINVVFCRPLSYYEKTRRIEARNKCKEPQAK